MLVKCSWLAPDLGYSRRHRPGQLLLCMFQTSVLIKVFIGRITLALFSFTSFSFASYLSYILWKLLKVTMKLSLDSLSTFMDKVHRVFPLSLVVMLLTYKHLVNGSFLSMNKVAHLEVPTDKV